MESNKFKGWTEEKIGFYNMESNDKFKGWTEEEIGFYKGLCEVTKKACEEQGVTPQEFGKFLVRASRPPWWKRAWKWMFR